MDRENKPGLNSEVLDENQVNLVDLYNDDGTLNTETLATFADKVKKHQAALLVVHPLYFQDHRAVYSPGEMQQKHAAYIEMLRNLILKSQKANLPVVFFLEFPESESDHYQEERHSYLQKYIANYIATFQLFLENDLKVTHLDAFVVITQPGGPYPLIRPGELPDTKLKITRLFEEMGLDTESLDSEQWKLERNAIGKSITVPMGELVTNALDELILARLLLQLKNAGMKKAVVAGSFLGGGDASTAATDLNSPKVSEYVHPSEVDEGWSLINKKLNQMLQGFGSAGDSKNPYREKFFKGCAARMLYTANKIGISARFSQSTFPEKVTR